MNKNLKAVEHGFALGKFMPLHAGHVHMLRVAEQMSEKLTIMVCSLPTEPIPGLARVEWVRQLFPKANVVHLAEVIPQEPSEHPQFWDIWRETIRRLVEKPIDGVFASETYGWRLASELEAKFFPVDRARQMIPVSGTAIRENPYQNWQYLPEPVKPYFVKRVAIVGPESVGKSTLAEKLGKHFNTIWVEEYARQLFDEMVEEKVRAPGDFWYEDLETVARGQQAIEHSLAHQANKVLITDTDVLTTMTWADYLYGKHEPWFEEVAKKQSYDLTLLLRPEGTQHIQDGGRVMVEQDTRVRFADALERNLKRFKRPYLVLDESQDTRFKTAINAIESLFKTKNGHIPE